MEDLPENHLRGIISIIIIGIISIISTIIIIIIIIIIITIIIIIIIIVVVSVKGNPRLTKNKKKCKLEGNTFTQKTRIFAKCGLIL